MSGKMVFARKDKPAQTLNSEDTWKVLVVDDEVEVHAVTRLALKGMGHRGRGLEILSAHSAAEARTVLGRRSDIAIVLLDVVMETEDAGLQLVRHIRQDLGNRFVRIILRTGQPGQAPEERVIVDYDINDYKAKTELTAQKLFTCILSALRAYDDIMALETHRRGLRQIIDATDSLLKLRSLQQFAAGVLTQLGAFLGVGGNGIVCAQRRSDCALSDQTVFVLAATREMPAEGDIPLGRLGLEDDIQSAILWAFINRANLFDERHTVFYLGSDHGQEVVAYLHCPPPAAPLARDLIQIFCSKIAIGFSNLYLYDAVVQANASLECKVAERTRDLAEANAILERLATTDPLTGAYNRRYFLEAAEREHLRAERSGAPYAVVMVDVDHFKRVNDTYGHGAGDEVLKAVVQRLTTVLRGSDVLGRMGGEEFALLLPDCDAAQAIQAAERFRRCLARPPVEAEGRAIPITASFGLAVHDSGDGIERMLSRADAALYEAKRAGRNRVMAG